MTGYKTNADVNKAVQAHSCYSYQGSVSVDQGFDVSKISKGEFNIPFYNGNYLLPVDDTLHHQLRVLLVFCSNFALKTPILMVSITIRW